VEEDGLFIAENGSWDKELQEFRSCRSYRIKEGIGPRVLIF
jgi:hypothetical protein